MAGRQRPILGAATSAETVLEKLLKSKETLVQAARCDADVLLTYIDDNGGSAMRREVDQKAEGLFDDLLAIVADGLAGLAQTSQDFPRNAFLVALDNHDSLMGGQEAVMRLVQGHGQDLSMLRKALEEIREGAPRRAASSWPGAARHWRLSPRGPKSGRYRRARGGRFGSALLRGERPASSTESSRPGSTRRWAGPNRGPGGARL